MKNKITYRLIILLIILPFIYGKSNAQVLSVINPSFEGTHPNPHVTPSPWVTCGLTPDTQPGAWGITMSPTDGSSYIGLVNSGSWEEGASQQLSAPMIAGVEYMLKIDLTRTGAASGGITDGNIELRIYGGNSLCSTTELLWSSGNVPLLNWTTYNVCMTPSANYSHLWLLSNRLTGSQPYILVDNMSDIAPCLLDVTADIVDEACGGGDGSITVTVNDGTPGYTYHWNTGESTNSINNLSSGSHSITITDSGVCPYCSFTGTYTVNSSNNLTVNYTVNTGCGGANDASIDLTVVSGNSPYTYTWADGPGTEDRNNLSPGTYYVTVVDAGTCSTTLSIGITPPPALTASITGANVSCNGGTDGNANLTVNGGTLNYTYLWSPGAQTTEDLNNIPAGNYSVTVTDANSCTTTASVNITEPSAMITNITGTDVSCNGGSDGSADLTVSNGTFPYTYIWSPGGQTTEDINNIPAGQHCVTVTDANSCSVTTCVTITEPTAITANITGTDVLCNGGASGSADLTVGGGTPNYTYLWSPGAQTTEDINNIPAGIHCVTVTDANSCTATTCVTITEPTVITASITGTDVFCNGGTDGSADLTVNGGTPNYTYLWSPGAQTTEDINNIPAGQHCVTITDANSCTATTCVTITEPPPIILSTTSDQSICIGQNTVISVSVTGGGTPDYTYLWSPATGLSSTTITNPTANPTVTTTYIVTVTDANACTATDNVIVTINPNPIANAGADKIICDGFSTIIGGIPTASGGTQPYTYLWGPSTGLNSTNVANPTANPSTTTVYTVTVTDDNGCTANTDDMTVTVNPSPNINFGADVLNGCEPLFVNFTDNTTPNIQSYIWNFGDPNSGSNNVSIIQNPSHLFNDPGTYNITLSVTTTDGCNGIYTYQDMITVYPNPVASFYPQPEIGNMVNPNISFIDQSVNANTWDWNFGEPASGGDNTSDIQLPNHTYSDTGTYTVCLIVISQYGCIDSTCNDVIIKPEFTFYVPNAFTPDDDDINDYFVPKGSGIDLSTFEMYIYNRWGEEIYKTNNMDEPWDGKVKGSGTDAQQGVYSWLVFVKALNGKTHKFMGHVTLVR